jgi:hypothetical protein
MRRRARRDAARGTFDLSQGPHTHLRHLHFAPVFPGPGGLQRSAHLFAKLANGADAQSLVQQDPLGFRKTRLMALAFRELHEPHTAPR